MKTEKLLGGKIGFYHGPPQYDDDKVPTFEQCRQMVREFAHDIWQKAGEPGGTGEDFWLQAEKILFNGLEPMGYRIYVCDESQAKKAGHNRVWLIEYVNPPQLIDGFPEIGEEIGGAIAAFERLQVHYADMGADDSETEKVFSVVIRQAALCQPLAEDKKPVKIDWKLYDPMDDPDWNEGGKEVEGVKHDKRRRAAAELTIGACKVHRLALQACKYENSGREGGGPISRALLRYAWRDS